MAERVAEDFPLQQELAARWLGLPVRGRPVFHLVADGDAMRAVAGPGAPEWAVAVTLPDDRIVLRLDRVDRAPAERLLLVLRHEVVHQLLNHLHGRLPRWFEEGLCVYHAGIAYLEPDASLERTAAAGHLPAFAEADALFAGSANRAALGYKFGQRAVRAFVERFGDESVRRLLHAADEGRAFPEAFEEATGVPLARFEREWRADVTPRVPFWLFLILENLELSLLFFGALLVAGGYLHWRLRRRGAMERLGD